MVLSFSRYEKRYKPEKLVNSLNKMILISHNKVNKYFLLVSVEDSLCEGKNLVGCIGQNLVKFVQLNFLKLIYLKGKTSGIE